MSCPRDPYQSRTERERIADKAAWVIFAVFFFRSGFSPHSNGWTILARTRLQRSTP